ncbi:MAG TPA: hypothetical protein VMB26_13655 [Candidatus Binataceae bacterium]|nr:hypothetical protein [Candidatus Binataceae bacterium]
MKVSKFLNIAAAAVLASFCLTAVSASSAQAQLLEWHRIFGIPEAFNVVGSGTGAVTGGAPWVTSSGHAIINLKNGKVSFEVKGLVLAVGGNATAMLSGLQIGTPAGVTEVEGTVVCNVSGATNGGNSVLVNTTAVPLSETGNASFSGNVGPFPSACSTSDIAFLIRIVDPTAFGGLWIAAGGVLDPSE